MRKVLLILVAVACCVVMAQNTKAESIRSEHYELFKI